MTWHDPKTWNTGDLLTAQEMNSQLRDNLRYLKELPYAQSTIRQETNYSTGSRGFVDIGRQPLSLTLRTAGAAQVGFLGTFQMDRSSTLYLDLTVDGVRLGNDREWPACASRKPNEPNSFAFTFLRDQLTPANAPSECNGAS